MRFLKSLISVDPFPGNELDVIHVDLYGKMHTFLERTNTVIPDGEREAVSQTVSALKPL